MMIEPGEAARVLGERRTILKENLDELEGELGGEYSHLPRVTMLETEYLRAVTRAELDWLDAVIGDLEAGTLSCSYEELAAAVVDDGSVDDGSADDGSVDDGG
jgi:hypothetical protein